MDDISLMYCFLFIVCASRSRKVDGIKLNTVCFFCFYYYFFLITGAVTDKNMCLDCTMTDDGRECVPISLDERVKVGCSRVRLDGLCPPQFG